EFDAGFAAGDFNHAAGYQVSRLVLGEVFIQSGGNQLLHAQAHLPLVLIDRQHLGLNGLAKPEDVLRMMDVLARADLAHVHHPFYSLRELHKRAELGNAGHGPLDHGAGRELFRRLDPGIAQGLFETERDSAFIGIHAQDHRLYGLARLDHVAGLPGFLRPRHFREVDQSFNAGLKFHKRAELGHARHNATHALAGFVLLSRRVPGMWLQLFQPDRDSPLARIVADLEHASLNRLTDGEHVRRLADTTPRNIAYVEQGVHAADVDEGAVIGQAADDAANCLTFLDL